MIFRAMLAALALLGCGMAAAQEAPVSHEPVVTQHAIVLAGKKLSYSATAGLMPLIGLQGGTVGDMSYVAYAVAPAKGAQRPLAFLWNGGPGANSTPIQYGAFGPKRLSGDQLKPNVGTLLDVADLVFIDQIETGFGRISEGVRRDGMLNTESDAREFAQFIETFLKSHGGNTRPVFLIGESYGVLRAVNVSRELLKRGIAPEGIVLISGYQTVGTQLPLAIEGALRLPGYAALAYTRGQSDPAAGMSAMQVHETAMGFADTLLDWLNLPLSLQKNPQAGLLSRMDILFGAEAAERFRGLAAKGNLQDLLDLIPRLHWAPLFGQRDKIGMYDMRSMSSGAEWISRAVVDDIRKDLLFDPPRHYIGQEAKPEESGLSTPAGDARVVSPEESKAFMQSLGISSITPVAKPRADGLADAIASPEAVFPIHWPVAKSPMPDLLASNPKLDVFIAGGIFDDLLPCAVGEEVARRDLAGFEDRVSKKCYAGGHMMYGEEAVGAELSDDVRAFIRRAG